MTKRQEDRDRASRPWLSFEPRGREDEQSLEYIRTHTPRSNWVIGKNYNLFAIIADHRNRRGDARFTDYVIAAPRGLPSDISDEVLEDATRGFGDGALTRAQRLAALGGMEIVAPSWVALRELLSVDWDLARHGEGVRGEGGDFLAMLRDEIVPIGPLEQVRLVFFFDS